MTPRSVRRAAERKEKRPPQQVKMQEAIEASHGATMPVPELPQPAASRYASILIAGESSREFDEFSERLDDHYMPFNLEERVFVGKLVESRWFLQRRRRVFESIETELYAVEPDSSKWTETDFKRLALADSYRMQAEQAVCRAHRQVNAFMQQRIEDYHYETDRDIAVRRLELQKKKYELALRNAEMRATQAAASGGAELPDSTKSAVAT